MPGKRNFSRKYGVDYDDFGCMAYCSDKQMAEYNTVIMDYLTVIMVVNGENT